MARRYNTAAIFFIFFTILLTYRFFDVEKEPEVSIPEIVEETVPEVKEKQISIKEKKLRFRSLLVPAVDRVFEELEDQYKDIEVAIQSGTDVEKIAALKKEYLAKSDEELLAALKPHPRSVALAQAALESSWATSRFFKEANNVFGVWSFNKNEPRIAAEEQRGSKTIWLKKYPTVYASVKDNYRILARGRAYSEFRNTRLVSDNPYELVTKLNNYSEKGEAYGQELAAVISYNKFVLYDKYYYNFQDVALKFSDSANALADHLDPDISVEPITAVEKAALEDMAMNFSVMNSVDFGSPPDEETIFEETASEQKSIEETATDKLIGIGSKKKEMAQSLSEESVTDEQTKNSEVAELVPAVKMEVVENMSAEYVANDNVSEVKTANSTDTSTVMETTTARSPLSAEEPSSAESL